MCYTRTRNKRIYPKTRRWKVNKNFYKKPKIIFESLKTDKKSVPFSKKKLSLKKCTYVNDKKLLKLINVAKNSIKEFNKNNNKIRLSRKTRN